MPSIRRALVPFLLLPSLTFAGDYERGREALKKKDYDLAIACFNAHLRENPKSAAAFNGRGIALHYKKEYDKAIKDYSEAIRLVPKYALPLTNRGIAYARKKEYYKAIEDYSEALRLDPKYANAQNSLGWLLATCPNDNLREGQRAVELATTACALSDWKKATYLDTLAAAHAECGDFKEAVKWQKKAIDLGFDDKEDLEKARQRLKLYEEGKPYRNE